MIHETVRLHDYRVSQKRETDWIGDKDNIFRLNQSRIILEITTIVKRMTSTLFFYTGALKVEVLVLKVQFFLYTWKSELLDFGLDWKSIVWANLLSHIEIAFWC